MSLTFVTEIIIQLWPVLLVLAALFTLFLPDRVARRSNIVMGRIQATLWVSAISWFLPIWMALSVRHKGDLSATPFWGPVSDVLVQSAARFTASGTVLFSAAYAAAGLVWAVGYFWLYARRLGQKYVMERDQWMRSNQLESLGGMSALQRNDFDTTVLGKVKGDMVYEGDFPLRPLQQKRFFAANLILWPATLLGYMIGDMALDFARHVWFVLRAWIRRRWEAGMAEYLADEALCRSYITEAVPS